MNTLDRSSTIFIKGDNFKPYSSAFKHLIFIVVTVLWHFICFFQENCMDFEALVISQCDSLIDALNRRKQELLDFLSHERERKTKILKDQAAGCTSHLQKTTGLLYFCVEVLKESDPTSFLQVSISNVPGSNSCVIFIQNVKIM